MYIAYLTPLTQRIVCTEKDGPVTRTTYIGTWRCTVYCEVMQYHHTIAARGIQQLSELAWGTRVKTFLLHSDSVGVVEKYQGYSPEVYCVLIVIITVTGRSIRPHTQHD